MRENPLKANLEGILQSPTVREAILYERMPDDKVRCGLCERRCLISPGTRGFCGTRINVDGTLYTLVYGDLSSLESRPIEIKPFFHYWPGSTALTYSTWSCNLDCIWCQNWTLSKVRPNPQRSRYYAPESVVEAALRAKDDGLCSSFQEPTLLTDWNVELFKEGRAKGLYCCYVSNGYMTLEALKVLWDSGMDGLKIDVKGDPETYRRYCGGVDAEVVWRNAREAKKMGFHVEIVNLVVTDVNDDEGCLSWVIERHLREVGPETPLHFTRYYPAYRLDNPSTRVETLERAYEAARDAGVLYPYIGNVHGHKYEHTYCPNCGEALIKRFGYRIVRYRLTEDKRCPKCKYRINLRGRHVKKRRILF
ncbi:MAG: pyruvate formate lyase-activating protein [Candidatus Bathyarchaeota archaeon B26-2]|nr:MAG: pyruvate formate lyase-activating protein [Candidatus Bathyarchaeota archaeon B26-2]